MDSIIAHAYVLSLIGAEAVPTPDQWRHDKRDGSLSYRYDNSPNTFTWGADAVVRIAARAGADQGLSIAARHLMERWKAVQRVVEADGLTPPDYFTVDHVKDEFTVVWEERKLVLIIGGDDDPTD